MLSVNQNALKKTYNFKIDKDEKKKFLSSTILRLNLSDLIVFEALGAAAVRVSSEHGGSRCDCCSLALLHNKVSVVDTEDPAWEGKEETETEGP